MSDENRFAECRAGSKKAGLASGETELPGFGLPFPPRLRSLLADVHIPGLQERLA